MSLWKLRVGVEAYYLSQVAAGLDEYYTGAGEAPGRWLGGGTAALGLVGDVDAADLRAVLAGLAPDTGLTPNGEQIRPHARRVPGFDLTFSPPKSVSVLYALGDPHIQATVIDACERAVRHSVEWLEREAAYVRRGSNDQTTRHALGDEWGTRRMGTTGFVAAQFRHRTSRAGDPQLHWHVLVANLAQGIDGRWSALDATALYRTQRTAGVLFRNALQHELTNQLGVDWHPTAARDMHEIVGIPTTVLRLFSRRREQIEEWLDSHYNNGSRASEHAALATRTTKPTTVAIEGLDHEWKSRATDAGWGPDQLEQFLATRTPPTRTHADRATSTNPPTVPIRVDQFADWLHNLVDQHLTAHDSTFDRHDITRAIAATHPTMCVDQLERTADRVLAHSELVALAIHQPAEIDTQRGPIIDISRQRYTSRRLLDLEARFLHHLTHQHHAHIPAQIVETVVAARTLGDDQTAAVHTLTGDGPTVRVMVGRAGTGKTYTLAAVTDTYHAAGYHVVGLATSARAARELADGTGLDTHTIASFLHHPPTLNERSVVIIDEAGMTGTHDLVAVTDRTIAARARVILVGDHHQLPEITAGGAFAAAVEHATHTGHAAELTINRRQTHAWEHAALDHLRHGDIATAWGCTTTTTASR